MKNTQGGFVQISILIALIMIGFIAAGGGYYATRHGQEIEISEDVRDSSINPPVEAKTLEEIENEGKPPLSSFTILKKADPQTKTLALEQILAKGKKIKPVSNSKIIEAEKTSKYIQELIALKEEVDIFEDAAVELRLKIVDSETKISDFRIEKLKSLAMLAPTEIISLTYGELVKIEEIRKKNVKLIQTLSSDLDATLYPYELKKAIASLEGDDIEDGLLTARKLIDAHPDMFSAIKEKSKAKIESILVENQAYAQEFLLRMESVGAVANQYTSALNALEEIEQIKKDIENIQSSMSYESYFVLPSEIVSPLQGNANGLTCKFPTSKYILVPGEGWVAVKQCGDGAYIKDDKYVPDTSSMTPGELCDAKKAAWLSQDAIISPAPDCSDLEL